jgi:hypothetical protein
MKKKFSIFRSQTPKLSQMNPELLKLWDEKYVKIQKAKEEEEEEKQKTNDELLKVIIEAVAQLQESLGSQITEEPKAKDLKLIAKSLESEGLNGRFVRAGRRVKIS